MSDQGHHIDAPDDDLLAAEYVLGVLDAPQRSDIERRIARERAFADLVAAWETRLAPWTDEIAPVAPSPEVWQRIAEKLPAQRATQSAGWWNAISLWRGLAIGASSLAAASLVALFVVVSRPAPAPLIAAIAGGGHQHFVATVDAAHANIAVVPAAFSADATRVPELWLIPPGGKPHSLGLLRADRTVTITIPPNLVAHTNAQAVLAVSLEPTGGSPTGQPTGPVIAQGKLTSL